HRSKVATCHPDASCAGGRYNGRQEGRGGAQAMTRCFVDLDGVLVDFHAGAARHHGVPYPDPWPAGVWHVDQVLGIDHVAFWSTLDEHFWAELQPTVDGRAIVELLEETFGAENVCL